MSRLSDLLTQQLEARLKIQDEKAVAESGNTSTENSNVTEANTQTTGTETQVAQQQVTESQLVSILKQSGIALPEGTDDASAAKQIAELVAANQRRDQELQRLQQEQAQVQERLRQAEIQAAIAAQQQQQKPQAQQETAQQVASEAKKWTQIELDPALAAICKFDETTRRFIPDPQFGVESQAAASKLNANAQEQARRERLLFNDPLAALSEAGLTDVIKKMVSEEVGGFKGEIQKTIEQRRQEAEQLRAQQAQQAAENEFFQKYGPELYQFENGQPVVGLDSNPVLTQRGRQFTDKVSQLMAQFGGSLREVDIANLAYQMLPPVVDAQQQAQQQAEVKKQSFVDKTRSSQAGPAPSRQMNPNEIRQQLTEERSLVSGITRFSDMFMNDPANKELLASQYGSK